jgi:hypothetical protein
VQQKQQSSEVMAFSRDEDSAFCATSRTTREEGKGVDDRLALLNPRCIAALRQRRLVGLVRVLLPNEISQADVLLTLIALRRRGV